MSILGTLLMLGILSALIIVHEFGHFSVARFFGFQTPVFGFGLPFGPSWTLGEKWGTKFRVHALLLGGYVAIPELGDESASNAEEVYGVKLKPFRKFPIWQRALVAFAGVAFNMLFAYVIMVTMLFCVGEPAERVYVYSLPPDNPIAANAGVHNGDYVLAINDSLMKNPDQVVDYLTKRKSQEVTLHIFRPNTSTAGKSFQELTGTKIDIKVTTNKSGKVGMALSTPLEKTQGNFFEISGKAFVKLSALTGQMVQALGRMCGSIGHSLFTFGAKSSATSGPGLGDVHGVLYIIKFGADLAQTDWTQMFIFSALINMDLAIINLLPIPALDGGHLMFMLIEALRGKPMNERIQGNMVKWGFATLLILMAIVLVNDVRGILMGEADLKKPHRFMMKTNQQDTQPTKR